MKGYSAIGRLFCGSVLLALPACMSTPTQHTANHLGSHLTAKCHDGKCGHKHCSTCNTGHKPSIFDEFGEHADAFDYQQLHPDKCWPRQYVRESQRRVYAPFGQQMVNGNRLELTVWEHLFMEEEGKEHLLSQAGEARLKYLARKKPFVIPYLELQTSFDRELDAKRVATVIDFANRYSFEDVSWQVSVVNREPTGLFGPEGPRVITKMVGPGPDTGTVTPPFYEPQIKQTFATAGGGE